jgi:ATP-dependent helicase/nuclease subunit A
MEFLVSSTTSQLNTVTKNEIVRAGAGAGKTYTLTHRVMDLADQHLHEHDRLPRIVVTTFTRKATQELRERLMLLALDERPQLIDFVNSRAHLVVSTIHGIMDLFLKRYGSGINVDPAYQMIDSAKSLKLARQTLRELTLNDGGRRDLLDTFSFNTLVSLVRRIDGILSESPLCKPFSGDEFAALFASRAETVARHLRDVVTRIVQETDKPNWLEIADSCSRMANLLRGENWVSNRALFRELREAMPIARRSSKGAQPVSESTMELTKEARELAGEFLEPVYDPGVWELFATRYRELEALARDFSSEFQSRKLSSGKFEISDLERLAMKCIREKPDAAAAFAADWDFWLVDEYQDTSPFQVELLGHLIGDRPSFIVGDPQQSIYLFRGARAEVFAAREREIVQSKGVQRLLSVNRRSRPELLLFFNDFFARLDPPFQAMQPFLKEGEELTPSSVVARVFIGREVSSAEGTEQQDDEMAAIVRHIQELLNDETVHPEDVCVLARTNQVLTEVAEHLNLSGLPTHVHAASGFFDRREIRDALALLKFLLNPHDNFNTIELLRSPWFKVPDQALSEITRRRPESIWAALETTECRITNAEGLAIFNAVERLSELLKTAVRQSLSEAFTKGLICAGFIDFAHLHDVSGRREANIWKLLARLQVEERAAGFNPLAFLSGSRGELKLDESQSEGDAVAAVEPNRINLMTVHASKGLEFKHVVLPRMAQKPRLTTNESFTVDEQAARWAARVPFGEDQQMTASLPEVIWLERFRQQELAEHARVLYVALTRASQSVFLSWRGEVPRDSWASSVRMNLDSGMHHEKCYSYLVERAVERATDRTEPFGESTEEKVHKAVERSVRSRWHEAHSLVHQLRSVSVTEIVEGGGRIEALVSSSSSLGEDKDLVRLLRLASNGTAVHRLMELLKYPSREHLERLIGKWFPGDEDRVLNAVNFVRESTAPPLLEIIMNGEVEKGFALTENGFLIEGQIDLWGRTHSGQVWIVDYKSGNPAHREKAFRQMGLYALALRRSGWLREEESLQLAAVYPFAQKIYTAVEPDLETLRASITERR